MTKAAAKILAGMLSDGAVELLRHLRERKDLHGQLTSLNEVLGLKLAEKTTNLLDGKEILVLTKDGKKVAEFA